MIKITFYSIDIGAEVNTYADGDWDLEKLYVLDAKGCIAEELPDYILSDSADREIFDLIQNAMDSVEHDCDESDDWDEPQYSIRGVLC